MADPARPERARHGRVLATLSLLAVLMLASASVIAVYGLDRYLARQATHDLRRIASLLASRVALLPAGIDDKPAIQAEIASMAPAADARLTVIAADGGVIAGSAVQAAFVESLGDRAEVIAAARDGVGVAERESTTLGGRHMYVAVPVRIGGRLVGFARAARPSTHLADTLRMTVPLLMYLTIGAGITLVLGHLARKRVERQSLGLLDAAEAAGALAAESERRLTEAQRVAGIGSWDWDLQANGGSWSDNLYRMFGVEPGAFQPSLEKYLEFIHPDDRVAVQRAARRAAEQGSPVAMDTRIVRPDGRAIVGHLRGQVVTDQRGKPARLVGTILDVTDLRHAEAARQAAEEQFRAFVETTNEWIWTLDTRGRLLYSNAAVKDILGYELDELIGSEVLNLLHPDDRAPLLAALPEMVRERADWTGVVRRWLHRNGEWRYVESNGTPILDENGAVVGFRGSARDITERTIAEEAFRKSEERFQLAARASNDVLWDWDFASGEIWRSEAVRRLFGHTGVVDQPWDALLHPQERILVGESLKEFLDSDRETWVAEYRFQRGDGSYAWVLDRGIVIRDEAGKPLRMIGTMMDISERKEAERMKSDFVSFVSHQLRTPLSGMNWMLELAAEAGDLPPQAAEYIADARESAARLGTLVNDLLDIARLESGRTIMAQEPVRLDEITRSVLREMNSLIVAKRHTVRVDSNGTAPVLGDQQMMRQVIANLVSNAVKYTPDGGQIDIAIVPRRDRVEWSVRDNGMGIPQVAQGRLFEKFFRADNAISREAEGTGLGLHLVRLVIEHAGGQIWCESEEGRGARFAFTLPTVQREGANA